MAKKYILTFDIDWAPDFAIRHCLDMLDRSNVSGTFFVTHDTPLNTEVIDRGHILGIHPNFLPNSSQGSNVRSIIEECLSYAPNAWCMRTHSLVQSTPLLYEIFLNFPQLRLDVSLLMHRSLYAHKCNWELDGVVFERLLYNWEDDTEFERQKFGDSKELFFGDLTVCNFHPIHVFLNSSDGKEYSRLKEKFRGTPLNELEVVDVAPSFQNKGIGVNTHLEKILLSNETCLRLDEI